eukprot:3333450-Pyramimonas_sp.AAC.1
MKTPSTDTIYYGLLLTRSPSSFQGCRWRWCSRCPLTPSARRALWGRTWGSWRWCPGRRQERGAPPAGAAPPAPT